MRLFATFKGMPSMFNLIENSAYKPQKTLSNDPLYPPSLYRYIWTKPARPKQYDKVSGSRQLSVTLGLSLDPASARTFNVPGIWRTSNVMAWFMHKDRNCLTRSIIWGERREPILFKQKNTTSLSVWITTCLPARVDLMKWTNNVTANISLSLMDLYWSNPDQMSFIT